MNGLLFLTIILHQLTSVQLNDHWKF